MQTEFGDSVAFEALCTFSTNGFQEYCLLVLLSFFKFKKAVLLFIYNRNSVNHHRILKRIKIVLGSSGI